MARSVRTVAGTAALMFALLAAGGGAQQPAQPSGPPPPAPDQQQPIFKAGINFVRVDVIITDKNGNIIGDLQPGDFDVVEDGKAQKIETFKLVKLDGGSAEAATAPPKQIRSDYDEATKEELEGDSFAQPLQGDPGFSGFGLESVVERLAERRGGRVPHR